MKKYFSLFLLVVVMLGCKKEELKPGEPPTANAGIDQNAVVGSTVTLNGTGTDPDGDELTFSWAITTSPSGSNASITNPSSQNASFIPDVEGTYTLTLSVSDGIHADVTDEAIITVTEAVGNPPFAVIRDKDGRVINESNENNRITITQTFELDGSSSSDPDQDELSFQWSVVSKPDGSNPEFSSDTNAETGFVPDLEGEYLIQLEVTDPNGNSNVAQVTIIASADPMIIDSDVNENTILENIFDNPDMADYLVVADIDVNAELTIEPGVVIEFQLDKLLKIDDSGMISAEGSMENPIVFTSSNVPGEIRWAGILIESSDARNSLNNVVIKWAGSEANIYSGGWETAALSIGDGSKIKLKNTTISNSGDYGLFVHSNGELSEFSDNSFQDNEGFPVGLYAMQAGSIDGNSTFSGNRKDVVEINKSTLISNDEVQWNALNNARYHLTGDLTVNALLRIAEGARFELEQEVGIIVAATGALIAKGTATNKILFTTANENGQVHWSGIIIKSSDARNELDYVDVSWAAGKSNFYYDGWQDVSVGIEDKARLTITNSKISKGKADGIFVHPGARISMADLTFEDNQGRPVVLSANQAVEVNEGFQFANNSDNVIAIYRSDFTNTEKNTWVALPEDANYLVMHKINITEPLNVNAGATLKFTEGASLLVKESGALNAVGTGSNMITFTAHNTGVKWDGISIETNSNNKLNYCEISYGGNEAVLYSGGWRKANVAVKGTLEIQNSIVKNSGGTGLFISKSSMINGMDSSDPDLESTLLSENSFSNNAESDITIE